MQEHGGFRLATARQTHTHYSLGDSPRTSVCVNHFTRLTSRELRQVVLSQEGFSWDLEEHSSWNPGLRPCKHVTPGDPSLPVCIFPCKWSLLTPERLPVPAIFPDGKFPPKGHDTLKFLKVKTRSLRLLCWLLVTEIVHDLRTFWARCKSRPTDDDAC